MESATVACKVCGYEATVYRHALGSVTQLDRQLPLGWAVRQEVDDRTGERTVIVLCPNHRDKEHSMNDAE